MDKKKDPRLDNARIMIRTAAPVVAAVPVPCFRRIHCLQNDKQQELQRALEGL